MSSITEPFTGTHAVDSTEWSLVTDSSGPDAETSDGIFQVVLDLSDMIAGDELQLRIYEKCRAGDTQRVATQRNLIGAQGEPLWISPSLILLHGWDVTAKAIVGTITVLWSIRKVG